MKKSLLIAALTFLTLLTFGKPAVAENIAQIEPSITYYNFGLVSTLSPKILDVTIINVATDDSRMVFDANGSSISILSQTPAIENSFQILPPDEKPCNAVLAKYEVCHFKLAFSPKSLSSKTAVVSIKYLVTTSTGDTPVETKTTVGGSGYYPLKTQSPINFGEVCSSDINGSKKLSVTFINSSLETIKITDLVFSEAGEFSIDSTTCHTSTGILGGYICTYLITFKPESIGTKTVDAYIKSNGLNAAKTTFIGTGKQCTPIPAVNNNFMPFGTVDDSSSEIRSISIKNVAAEGTLQITGASIFPSIDYSLIDSAGCIGTSAAPKAYIPNQSCTIQVMFSPKTAGDKLANLSITAASDASPSSVSVALSGTGVVLPKIVANPTSLDFGIKGSNIPSFSSPSKSIQIGKLQTDSLQLGNVTLSGDGHTNYIKDFQLAENCKNTTLTTQAPACSMTVTFTSSEILKHAAVISILKPDGSLLLNIPISGEVVDSAPKIAISPRAFIAADVSDPTQYSAEEFTIVNPSKITPLTINNITIDDENNTGSFVLYGTNCLGTTIPAEGNCVFQVGFEPKDAFGDVSAKIVIDSSADESIFPQPITLFGKALLMPDSDIPLPAIQVTPEMISAGEVIAGEKVSSKFQIKNVSALGTLFIQQINLNSEDFSLTDKSCVGKLLAPEAICNVQIEFAPKSSGDKKASVAITSNDPAALVVSVVLEGNGKAPEVSKTDSGVTPQGTPQGSNESLEGAGGKSGGCTLTPSATLNPSALYFIVAAFGALLTRRAKR